MLHRVGLPFVHGASTPLRLVPRAARGHEWRRHHHHRPSCRACRRLQLDSSFPTRSAACPACRAVRDRRRLSTSARLTATESSASLHDTSPQPSSSTESPQAASSLSSSSTAESSDQHPIAALMRHPTLFDPVRIPRNPIVLCHGASFRNRLIPTWP